MDRLADQGPFSRHRNAGEESHGNPVGGRNPAYPVDTRYLPGELREFET